MFRTMDVATGSACWRAEVSRTQRSWKTIKVVVGEIPGSVLDECIDVEEFMARVWETVGGRGYMGLTVVLAGGDVVWIESRCDSEGPEVLSFRHNAATCPGGFTGPWAF